MAAFTNVRLLGGILFFVSFFFVVLSLQEWRYERKGVKATGSVTKLEAGSGNRRSYYAFYDFVTKDGKTFQNRDDVLLKTYKRLQKGGPVEIEYIEGSPKSNRVAGDTVSAARK